MVLTSPRAKRINGSGNFRSSPKKRLLQQYQRLAQSGHSAESSAASTLLVSPWRDGAPGF
jgi:hypothetical protein